MAVKHLYKCNPLVARAAGVSGFSRYTWADGCVLLWENDLIAIDRERFFLDCDGLLADLGAVRMTDPQAAADQRNPRIRLPEARLPEYRWEQPDFSAADAGDADLPESEEDGTDGTEDGNGGGEGGER